MILGADATVSVLAADTPDLSAQLLGSGLIGLREGLETSIVVMILIAFLVKSERRDAIKWVWLGVAAALAMTLGVFFVIEYSAYTVSDLGAEAIAGIAS
ncbi:MAG: high-affinity iron transporter, partial [Mycobacterium sp.]|nr:high-affinity iron transporter [Mycobacterium sp.]